MSASLQFGPEWMRSKQASISSSIPRPPHTSTLTPSATQNNAVLPSSLYSSFVTSNNSLDQDKESPRNPFQYSKEELLQVWRDGGGRGALGVEIELWEGVVKELAGDPIGLKELNESEKQLFSSPLNSELRRRQSHDILPNSFERPKLGISASSGQPSSGQPRFSPLLARRRKEESTDPAVSLFRRPSLSSPLSPIRGPTILNSGLPSPRTKLGINVPTFDSILGESNCPTRDESREDISDNISGPDHSIPRESRGQTDNPKVQRIVTATAFRDEMVHGDLRSSEDPQVVTTLNDISSLEDVLNKHNDSFKLVGDGHSPMLRNASGFPMSGPPGFELDPTSITWLYRDPKGNIQGPFSATLMQKWYDEGYFAPDLLVKRSHLDNEWIMVGELAIHDLNGKLFLQLYPEYPSSELFSRGNELHDAQPFDYFRHSLGQPVVLSDNQIPDQSNLPTTFHRRGLVDHMSILDSHPSTLSASAQAASNINLLGASPSPERFFNHSTLNRTVALQSGMDRPTNVESAVNPPNGALTYGHLDNPELHLIPAGQFQASPNPHAHLNTLPSAWSRSLQAHNETVLTHNQAAHNDAMATVSFGRALYGSLNAESAYSHPPSSSVIHTSSSSHGKEGSFNGQNPPKITPHSHDSLHDAGPNVDLTGFLQNNDPKDSPTFLYDRPAVGEGPSRPLPSYNIPPSSQLYSSDNVQPVNLKCPPVIKEAIVRETEPTESIESLHSGDITDRTQQQSPPNQGSGTFKGQIPKPDENFVKNEINGESFYPTSELADKEVGLEPVSPPPSLAVAPDSNPLKPVWKTAVPYGDEVKLRLREIQEAETKKSEARKLVEREKDRNSFSINASIEETDTFPTTWGLSISQTGNSRLSKEPSQQHQSSTPSVHSVPVWPNTGKPIPAKKTMKEIQEEEEQKKKAFVKEKEAAQIAHRRAYAESANKSSLPQSSNGVWTTVGAGGRHSAIVPLSSNQSATRPASTTHTTAQSIISVKPAVNRPPPSISSSSKIIPKSNSNSMDSTPLPPSPEFMRWLRDSLRDFNPGFNTEEFMAMLLAFPLDFPPSTVEVIQDMVYMNSVTMDGRRFATEFCSKRKADVVNRPKNTNGKQPSLADVVKTQPKPSQNELPFKVVKKKGKGLNTGR